MRRTQTLGALAVAICGLTAALGADLAGKKARPGQSATEQSCGRHGTEVEFVPTPAEAAAQAKRDQKLVLVLHVSGHFETPEFT
jgi:hypothetical protein